MPEPLGVQLYTVREAIANDRDGALRRIADIGFTAVEPYDPTNDPTGFRRVADDLGFTVPVIHAVALVREDEPGPVFDAINTIGTKAAIVPAGIPEEDFTTRDGIARAADLLNGLAQQAATHGIQLGYHNHWWELEPVIEGRHALELLAELLDPAVFLELDTYWAALGGADVPRLLTDLGERVRALHVKDGPLTRDGAHLAVGAGVMPVRDILAAAPDALRIVELDSCDTDLFEALAASRAYLTTLEPA
ncbi:sugar phosphate isomerase/epimerase family protein [Streptomyces profundus]|uniref:sugar phosphate isomerase/epimerase family protein n=1 Tax=Streptomyces profundus TaxID=2867410 RepID=UPI001D16B3AA|nr:sugar phosphate isomerase/epimerase [Streptomyces sp. MA3_2.13]UED87264.1 sugar phosphate isomerase/epimerase [Streptomyces sp. MA3_2.13]